MTRMKWIPQLVIIGPSAGKWNFASKEVCRENRTASVKEDNLLEMQVPLQVFC